MEPMEVDLDFKSQFYNLQGILISERKKNFYKLLNSTSRDIPEDQIHIQPRNYQENIFYVDVLIYFKKVDKLIEVLKEGIGILTSRILKQQWFFKEAFKNMTEEDIVNTFFPTLSFSVRMKVLKKFSLALSEERMNKIFDLVLERYGIFIAKQFLFSCSPEKIIYVLKNKEITLSIGQLKRLLQKDVGILKVYIEEFKKNKVGTNHEYYSFMKYLAWKHPELYFDFELHNDGFVKLGRSTTRKVIKTNREAVLKDIKNTGFNKTALIREVKDFDKEYLFLFFPDDMKAISYPAYRDNLETLVFKYPIRKRWGVISQGFRQAYNEEIVDNLDIFEEKLAKCFPQEVQQKWAEIKYLENDDLAYIKYYNAKKAFKLLKDIINVTADIDRRGNLLNELFTVCYTSKDYSTYEEVLKYICMRHRNDDKVLRERMMFYLKKNIDYNLITEAHWKYINEIIELQRVKSENLAFNLITEYLLFAYRKQLSLNGLITQYIKDCIKSNRSFRLWYLDRMKRPEMESAILKGMVEILPTMEHENEEQVTFQLMSDILHFNEEIKKDKVLNKEFNNTWINFNDSTLIMDLIKKVCTKHEPYETRDYEIVNTIMLYNCLYSAKPLKGIDEKKYLNIIKTMSSDQSQGYLINHTIGEVIIKPHRNDFENALLDYFFSYDNEQCDYIKQQASKHFLDKEPEVFAKYFNAILPIEVKSHCVLNVLDFGDIKKYDHLGLCKKVVDYSKALVSVDSKFDKKVKLLNDLSRIMSAKDFVDLVKDYTPKTKKLDLNDQVQRDLYQIQCALPKAFNRLDDVSVLAPLLMHYCQGDYLQSSLTALYRVLYRIREEKTYSYINVLEVRATSTRKQAVYFGFELLPVKDAMKICSELSHRKGKITAKKYLFTAVLKYFIKNPLELVQDMVFLNMNFIDKNDNETIRTLVDSISKIPNTFKPIFIEKVWNFLGTLKGQEVKVTGFRNRVLHSINECDTSIILKLNQNSFVDNIIKKYFLSSDDSLQKKSFKIDRLVVNYLLAYLDEAHFEFIFGIIKSFRDIHWTSSDKEETVKYVSRFFAKAYEKFVESDVTFLKMFTIFWQQLFSPVELFSECTMLRLMAVYKENKNIELFSREVDEFFQGIVVEYGPYIGELLIKSLKNFFLNISTKHNTDFNLGNFAFYLLQSNSNEFSCFVAFNINKDFTNTDQKKIYSKVGNALKAVTNLTAQIYCNVPTS